MNAHANRIGEPKTQSLSRPELLHLVNAAISVDVLRNSSEGFIAVMAAKRATPNAEGVVPPSNTDGLQQDIPAAFEMYSLLNYAVNQDSTTLPVVSANLHRESPDLQPLLSLTPGIYVDVSAEGVGRVIVMLAIGRGDLSYTAHWITDSLQSPIVKALPGILMLPFSIEAHALDDQGTTRMLIPEWFAAFYVEGRAETCMPLLVLRSVLHHAQFGGDWVNTALLRLADFGLPHAEALAASQQHQVKPRA